MIICSNQISKEVKVSVIICSYNRPETISKTIDSIIEQKCNFPYEIIIGDDKSTEDVREILLSYQKKYPKQIILLFHEKNIGLGANWASCIKISRGEYIAGCDNDDFWHNKDKLRLQVEFLEKNPEYGMVHTDYIELNRKTQVQISKIIHTISYKGPLIKVIFNGNFKCCNSSVMYRRLVIIEHVFLNDYISFQFPLQDWYTWVSISKYTKFHCLPFSTTTVGIDSESITRPTDYENIIKRFSKEKFVYRFLCEKFPEDLNYNENVYDLHVNHILLNLAYNKIDYKAAKKYSIIGEKLGSRSLKTKFAH